MGLSSGRSRCRYRPKFRLSKWTIQRRSTAKPPKGLSPRISGASPALTGRTEDGSRKTFRTSRGIRNGEIRRIDADDRILLLRQIQTAIWHCRRHACWPDLQRSWANTAGFRRSICGWSSETSRQVRHPIDSDSENIPRKSKDWNNA